MPWQELPLGMDPVGEVLRMLGHDVVIATLLRFACGGLVHCVRVAYSIRYAHFGEFFAFTTASRELTVETKATIATLIVSVLRGTLFSCREKEVLLAFEGY